MPRASNRAGMLSADRAALDEPVGSNRPGRHDGPAPRGDWWLGVSRPGCLPAPLRDRRVIPAVFGADPLVLAQRRAAVVGSSFVAGRNRRGRA